MIQCMKKYEEENKECKERTHKMFSLKSLHSQRKADGYIFTIKLYILKWTHWNAFIVILN